MSVGPSGLAHGGLPQVFQFEGDFVIPVRRSFLPILGLALVAVLSAGCSSGSGEVEIPDTAPPEVAPVGAGPGESSDTGGSSPAAPEL